MEEYNPEISIIVPVYNSEKYLEECIKSILNQTFADFELILIDDGSDDSSGLICDKYAEKDKRIIVVHQENKGICGARNAGLDIARGKYIGFSDNDDYMHSQMYEYLYTAITGSNSDIACCYCKLVYDDSYKEEKKIRFDYKEVDKKFMYKNLYSNGGNDYQYMTIWNKLIDRNLFNNVRFIDEGNEDLFVNNILFNKASKIVFIESELYFWRQHMDSVSHRKFNERDLKVIETYLKNYEYLKKYSSIEYADLCLNKWFKVLLNKRYSSEKTGFETRVKEEIKKQFGKYKKNIYISKEISLINKIIYSIFYLSPSTYKCARKIMEKKSR